jgi:phosphopantothenoylcysteine decarboxylase/phosphopantothenate--cysteine ligase
VRVVRVETAAEMQCAVEEHAVSSDVIVMTAAVADFRPVRVTDGKWKKENGAPRIELEPTPDILAGLGAAKRPGQVLVGFAAETDNVEENARGKMTRKNLDIVVSNDVSAPGVGFGHDTNEVVIHLSTGACIRVPLSDKRRVAAHVLDSVVETRRRN